MNDIQFPETTLYYTACHEWIRVLEKDAYIGISKTKLGSTKKITKVAFVKVYGLKRKGDVFATIQMDFQQVDVHMPVDGTILKINTVDRLIHENLLLLDPEMEGWLAKIQIRPPLETMGLLSKEQYAGQ